MSAALVLYVTTTPDGLLACTVKLDGTESDGAVVSRTITSKLPLVVPPWEFVAVQSTVVVVIPKVEPEAGEQTTVAP